MTFAAGPERVALLTEVHHLAKGISAGILSLIQSIGGILRSLVRATVIGLSAAVFVSPAAALAAPTAHAAKKKHHKKKHHSSRKRGKRGARGLPGASGARGPQGPAGPQAGIHYRAIIVGAQSAQNSQQATPTTLLSFGPFALVGYCYRSTDNSTTPPTTTTNSQTYVVTSQNNSAVDSISSGANNPGNFNPGITNKQLVGETAAPDPTGQTYSAGDFFSVSSGDQQHSYHGVSANGARVRGGGATTTNPDCSFSGFVVDES